MSLTNWLVMGAWFAIWLAIAAVFIGGVVWLMFAVEDD